MKTNQLKFFYLKEKVLPAITSRVDQLANWIVKYILKGILTPLLLFLVYFIIVGFTSLVIKTFYRKRLKQSYLSSQTYWVGAQGYENDLEQSYRQS